MRRLISASLDGELSPEDEQRLRAHLDNCLECRQTRDAYRANRDLIQRNLPSNSDPPQFVTDEILRKTREISNSHGLRRLILGSRLRLTMSVVATIAVAFIASAFFMVQTYRAGIPAFVAGVQPNPAQAVDFLKPVTITFSKPMNDASVMDNLRMSPGQKAIIDAGYYHWDGSSLIIGVGKNGQSKPLTADTDYTIWIMPAAKDANGNPLGGSLWKVSFHTTSESKFASGTPAVTSSPSSTGTSIAQVNGTKTATVAGETTGETPNPSGTPTSSEANQTNTGAVQNQTSTATPPPTGASGTNGAGSTNGSSASNPATSTSDSGVSGTQATTPPSNSPSKQSTSDSGDTSTQSSQSPTSDTTATATSTPMSTATAPATQATTSATAASTNTETTGATTATGTPDPTSSATSTNTTATTSAASTAPSPTATKSGTADECQNPTASISGAAFGSVYWAYPDVCNKLGMPSNSGIQAQTSILTFQRGVMIERMDTKKVYILSSNGTGGNYQVVDAPSPSIADNGGTPAPTDNLWIPGGDLGKVWSDSKLQASIGYSTSQTADSSAATPIQRFQNGTMVYSDSGFVYVLYSDNTWQVYPDSSGHGALLTPTATTPSPTATVSPTTAP